MKNLRKLRKEAGLSMKQLGDIINAAESTISLYENGKREPDHDTLNKIADFFNVSTDYLLGRTDNKYSDVNDDELMIGLSREETGLLTEEDKEDIRKFAQFVLNKRKNK